MCRGPQRCVLSNRTSSTEETSKTVKCLGRLRGGAGPGTQRTFVNGAQGCRPWISRTAEKQVTWQRNGGQQDVVEMVSRRKYVWLWET